jgi:hypothetical protein
MHKGSCLCGGVQFEITQALHPPDACHCKQCRKTSGHYWASTDVLRTDITLSADATLSWYQSSEKVRRGFCAVCGSSLFWDAVSKDKIAVAMGAFDTPTRTHVALHIFVADKGDYYAIADGVPQNPT